MKKLFITATDTDAGKTFVATALVKRLTQTFRVKAFKPISAGCELVDGQLINEDAKLLHEQANAGQTIEQVNPIAFLEPIAPHIAAAKHDDVLLTSEIVTQHFDALIDDQVDIILTEGAGGWRLPLGNGEFLSDFAKETQQDVVLVVNMKLGCLNHARLTYETILNDGLTCVGWVANCIDEMPYQSENIAELKQLIDAPLLGVMPYCDSIGQAVKQLDISLLKLAEES